MPVMHMHSFETSMCSLCTELPQLWLWQQPRMLCMWTHWGFEARFWVLLVEVLDFAKFCAVRAVRSCCGANSF